MSVRPLPEHPNLDQLRRQAKELRDAALAGDGAALDLVRLHALPRPGSPITLSAAQLAVARSYGFPTWPRLKAEVESRTMDLERRVDAFLQASIEGRTKQAERLLATDRRIANFDVSTAAVLGDASRVGGLVAGDPALATRPDRRRGWPPLLYVCHSHWHRIDAAREAGMLEVARLLLDAGASADTSNGLQSRHGYRSALYGAAGIANNPAITRLLLEHGANPDDDESVYHAVYHRDHECLRLLVEHGAKVNGTNALPALIGRSDVEGVRILLSAGADPGRPFDEPAPTGHMADMTLNPLALAAASDSVAVVEVLVAAGADVNARCRDGSSAVRAAVRRGCPDVAEVLLRSGARDDVTELDRFMGACARADRAEAEALLGLHPGLADHLSDEDRAAIVDAAEFASSSAVELMLDLGFPAQVHRRHDGASPLHAAAYAGRADVVRLLIERGADVDGRDLQWTSTALGWASVGSGEQADSATGDWVATIEALLNAGAAGGGAWVESKPPSDEVAALLTSRGIGDADETPSPDVGGADTADLDRVAERLRAAFGADDLELLGSLLRQDVRWGWGPGGCHNRGQVLEWFGVLAARGVHARVLETVVRANGVVLGLELPGQAGITYQVFRVEQGVIVEINGYPGREEALASVG